MAKSSSKTRFGNLRNLEFRRERKFSRTTQPGNLEPKITAELGNIKLRLLIVWGVLIIAMVGLGCKLYQLQILDGKKLAQRARNQQMVNLRPYVPRRPIDRKSVV